MNMISLVLGTALTSLSLSVGALTLQSGNYKPLAGTSACDLNVEQFALSDGQSKLVLTNIASLQALTSCEGIGTSSIYICDAENKCQDNPGNKLEILTPRKFLTEWDDLQWIYVNNKPPQPAKRFTYFSEYGFGSATGWSVNGGDECTLRTEGNSLIYCNDTRYAQKEFCPQALLEAEQGALANCTQATGRNCRIVRRQTQIKNQTSNGFYNSQRGLYEFIGTDLFCRADVEAQPTK